MSGSNSNLWSPITHTHTREWRKAQFYRINNHQWRRWAKIMGDLQSSQMAIGTAVVAIIILYGSSNPTPWSLGKTTTAAPTKQTGNYYHLNNNNFPTRFPSRLRLGFCSRILLVFKTNIIHRLLLLLPQGPSWPLRRRRHCCHLPTNNTIPLLPPPTRHFPCAETDKLQLY